MCTVQQNDGTKKKVAFFEADITSVSSASQMCVGLSPRGGKKKKWVSVRATRGTQPVALCVCV